ncbi:MAG: 3'(2'),5'-bisphosphate nucleotidase CysQ [Gammaproteobacteria bacterium]|nr:3'(2'),5'-bisphosphate nucleotidase CysQ [Gammaproteobacteria bacterium]
MSPHPIVSPATLDAVRKISAEAGAEILKIYESAFSVEVKDDRTPLTEADLAAHRTIVAGLTQLSPEIPILSEESADIPFAERATWATYWLVDPLDGTREFIKRNGEFTVNIALINKTKVEMGVIWVPVTGVCYSAAVGLGAHKAEPGKASRSISVRPRPTDITVVAGSRSHGSEATQKFVENLGRTEMTAIGSSLKSCLVAEGTVDIYPRFGLTSEWDTAAAQGIVEQAGGLVTGIDLEPLRYNTKESLLNPDFLVFGDQNVDWRQYIS